MSPDVKISLIAFAVFIVCIVIILLPKGRRRKSGRDGADASGLVYGMGAGHHTRDNDHSSGFDSGGDGGD